MWIDRVELERLYSMDPLARQARQELAGIFVRVNNDAWRGLASFVEPRRVRRPKVASHAWSSIDHPCGRDVDLNGRRLCGPANSVNQS